MDSDLRGDLERGVIDALESASAEAMRWGRDDCALWCANVLRGVLGYDPAKSFRRRYRSRNGAQRVLGRMGLLGAIRGTARRHGWRLVPPADGQPGDIGIIIVGDVASTVICRAPGWFVGRSETGFTAIASAHVRFCWAVI